MADDLLFGNEVGSDNNKNEPVRTYKLLVVDDEQGIHDVTRIALRHFRFGECGLEILSAYSGAGARELLSREKDIAVILLDVVMETPDAGLKLADWIRNEQGDDKVRIILRTGQPGDAPEAEIMQRYDINDYKEKTELTSYKMKTLMMSCLRTYADICTIRNISDRLEQILSASNDLFSPQRGEQFAGKVIALLENILVSDPVRESNRISSSITGKEEYVVHGTGRFAGKEGNRLSEVMRGDDIVKALATPGEIVWNQGNLCISLQAREHQFLIFIENPVFDADIERSLLELFFRYVSVGYANVADNFGKDD